MRVLDAGSPHTYKMGKNRKHRIRKSKENEAEESSDDGIAICSHIPKAVNFAAMRKALLKPSCTFGECTSCTAEATRSGAKDLFGSPLEGAAACVAEDSDTEPTIWVCLQCGHQGCDRNSRERHALKHYETPHSGIHCLVANLTTWTAWCYICDSDIPVENSKRILECVDFLRKQAGLPRIELSHFASQRAAQGTSPSDVSPTDPSPPSTQSRPDKSHSQGVGKTPVASCQKVKGLSNLGNTCFFNAVMQNLCQTHSLESQLVAGCKKGRSMTVGGWREPHTDSDSSADGEDEEDSKPKDTVLIDIVPGDPGPLTHSLLQFVQEMNNGSAHSTVTPNSLFSHVCKKAPRFKGFQQQDSHELLRYLLDVVRSEEIKRAQSGILRYFKLSESVNPKKVDEETKTKIKEYGRQVKYTFLDSLFGGVLVSTVTCEECKHISQIFEPFLDLSLPVTEEKPQRPNQMQGSRRKDSTASAAAAAGEVQEDASPSVGVDGFAERSDKPSKYQERKNRRQARKEAKRKGGRSSHHGDGQGKSQDGEDDEKDGGGDDDDHTREATASKGETHPQGGSNSNDAEEDNSSVQEDPSDADVEDNLESETSRLHGAADYETNLPASLHSSGYPVSCQGCSLNHHNNLAHRHRCDSDGDMSSSVAASKTCMIRENHILPPDLSPSCYSQPASLDSVREGEHQDVDKLTNSLGNLELDHVAQTTDRTQGPVPKPTSLEVNHLDHIRQMEGGSAPMVNHCDSRPTSSMSITGEVRHAASGSAEPGRKEGEAGKEIGLEAGDGAADLDRDMKDKLTPGGEAGCGSTVPNADKKLSLPNHMAGKTVKELRREARYKSKTTLAPRYQPSSKECSVMSCLHQFTAAELLTGSNKVSCKMCTKMRPKNATPHKDKKGSDTVYSNSAKQFLILGPPAVLTLHLKRFEQVGYTSRKVNRHVDFPMVLDLAPYCSSLCQDVRVGQRQVLYALYGVVEHSGRLQTGHYTAYVKVRPSLGPLTSFLHVHQPNPRDYIHRYMEQVEVGPGVTEEDTSEQPVPETLVPPGRWFHVSDSRINEVTEATVLKAQAYLLFYERVY